MVYWSFEWYTIEKHGNHVTNGHRRGTENKNENTRDWKLKIINTKTQSCGWKSNFRLIQENSSTSITLYRWVCCEPLWDGWRNDTTLWIFGFEGKKIKNRYFAIDSRFSFPTFFFTRLKHHETDFILNGFDKIPFVFSIWSISALAALRRKFRTFCRIQFVHLSLLFFVSLFFHLDFHKLPSIRASEYQAPLGQVENISKCIQFDFYLYCIFLSFSFFIFGFCNFFLLILE